jgi:hypothetical protein
MNRSTLGGRVLLAGALIWLAAPSSLVAQSPSPFSGIWVLDPARKGPLDVYGEVRVVEQRADDVLVTMVDYGSAWIEGAFRPVVRLVPWTFPFGHWAPRRGGPDSQQPLARSRLTGEGLVLAKRTVYGNGDFVWVWRLGEGGGELAHRGTDQPWDADFGARPPEGRPDWFLRATLADSTSAGSLQQRIAALAPISPASPEIVMRLTSDATTFFVTCPRQNCRIVELSSGRRVGERPVPMGSTASIPVHTEVIIEPVP